MLERIDSPENVLAVRAVGKVEKTDYENTLDPAIAEMIQHRDEVRFVYVLGEDFDGYSAHAVLQDAKLGMSHLSKWKRIAVVTDHDWIQHAVGMFGWMVPGDVKVFPVQEQAAAMEWAAG
jgi:hypothetical protein